MAARELAQEALPKILLDARGIMNSRKVENDADLHSS